MWDLWWTKWHCGRFSTSTSVSPAKHSTDCSETPVHIQTTRRYIPEVGSIWRRLIIFIKHVYGGPPLWSNGQSSWLQSGDVLCFLWGTNWIYICYVEESRQPLWSSGQSSWLQSGDVLCFLWGTNWIYICYVKKSRPPLWSSDQSSWLQIQRCGFDSRHYQIFWEVSLERGPLSLVRTTEELLQRKVAAPV
jgi:hypothetical protein